VEISSSERKDVHMSTLHRKAASSSPWNNILAMRTTPADRAAADLMAVSLVERYALTASSRICQRHRHCLQINTKPILRLIFCFLPGLVQWVPD
jgi:hypothetical protein